MILAVCSLIPTCCTFVLEARIPDEQRLLSKLLGDYDPAARPVFNASHVVKVYFGLTLTQISDMVSLVVHGVNSNHRLRAPPPHHTYPNPNRGKFIPWTSRVPPSFTPLHVVHTYVITH